MNGKLIPCISLLTIVSLIYQVQTEFAINDRNETKKMSAKEFEQDFSTSESAINERNEVMRNSTKELEQGYFKSEKNRKITDNSIQHVNGNTRECPYNCSCIWKVDGLFIVCGCYSIVNRTLPAFPPSVVDLRLICMNPRVKRLLIIQRNAFLEYKNLNVLQLNFHPTINLRIKDRALTGLSFLTNLTLSFGPYIYNAVFVPFKIFTYLTNLTNLDLSRTFWNLKSLQEAFYSINTSIHSLNLADICPFVPKSQRRTWKLTRNFLSGFKHACVKELDLQDNMIIAIELGFSISLPCLERLSLRKNYLFLANINFFIDLYFLRNLTSLDIGDQSTTQNSCIFRERTNYGALKSETKAPVVLPIPPNLKFVIVDNFAGKFGKIGNFDQILFSPFNNIETLDLADTRTYDLLNGTIIELYKLRVLNITNSRASIRSDRLFRNLTNLKYLQIAGNNMSSVTASPRNFRYNLKLKILNMSDTNIDYIHPQMFVTLTNLKFLDLSLNDLENITFCNYNSCFNLILLNLSYNKITSLDMDTVKYLDKTVKYLDLTGNPFVCSCKSVRFYNWLKQKGDKIINSKSYFCKFMGDGNKLVNILDNRVQKMCSDANVNDFTIILTVIFVYTMLTTLTTVMYRRRWQLLHWYRNMGKTWAAEQCQVPNELAAVAIGTEDEYDIFVAYFYSPSFFGNFLRKELMGNLDIRERNLLAEKQELNHFQPFDNMEVFEGFKLFIHDRDMTPGHDRIDATYEMMRRCKIILILLTDDFIADESCVYNLMNIAFDFFKKGKKVITIVYEEDVKAKIKHCRHAQLLVDNVPLFEWPEDEILRRIFWLQLKNRLQKELGHK